MFEYRSMADTFHPIPHVLASPIDTVEIETDAESWNRIIDIVNAHYVQQRKAVERHYFWHVASWVWLGVLWNAAYIGIGITQLAEGLSKGNPFTVLLWLGLLWFNSDQLRRMVSVELWSGFEKT